MTFLPVKQNDLLMQESLLAARTGENLVKYAVPEFGVLEKWYNGVF